MDKKTEQIIKYFAFLRFGNDLGKEESTINAFYEYLNNLIKNELIMANIFFEDVIDEVRKYVVEDLYRRYRCYMENDISDNFILIRFLEDLKLSAKNWSKEVFS